MVLGSREQAETAGFYEKTGKKGVMISAVDLLKGIAAAGGMTSLHVEGATGVFIPITRVKHRRQFMRF